MKLIDKDAVIAEIERRIEGINPLSQRVGVVGCSNTIKHLRGVLSFLNTLEVKEVNSWHKQSEEDIDDSINDWDLHSFICLMSDGTIQKFTGINDESLDGSINTHLDCVDDNYDWKYDDIIYWIEIPNLKAQKGE